MRIYVDFDDVLCETARELSRLAGRLYGCRVPYAEIRAFNLREAFDLDEARYLQLMRTAHEPEFLLELDPTPGAVGTLAAWAAAGHTVEIVTGRPWATQEVSRQWLERQGVGHLAIIHVDKYNRELAPEARDWSRALTPAEFATRQYDLAVEDAPVALRMLAAMAPCRVVIFDRPWNRGVPALNPHFTRCADWASIARLSLEHPGAPAAEARAP
ncbi:MAG: 2-dehydropantoate 2-reductase [Lentisphaerae bacterium]|nr:2-dehydropantoate 2-reductase [Lentisphaerota bacterium]